MKEHLSVCLIMLGTLVLIFSMSGSTCFSGERYHQHSSACGCPRGLLGARQDGLQGVKEGLLGVKNRDGLSDLDPFQGGQMSRGTGRNRNCPYKDDGDISTAEASQNYQQAIQGMSLEADVADSHHKWISELTHRTTTASKETIRDDPNDVNPWMGLRRPKYKTRAQPLAEARTIASDVPCEMLDNSGGYIIN